jgi:hypothetical protein
MTHPGDRFPSPVLKGPFMTLKAAKHRAQLAYFSVEETSSTRAGRQRRLRPDR